MILIFDTNGGLCNQFYDIINGINFCLKHNIHFTFRYCAFRNNNLTTWFQAPFEKLFDITFLTKYNLYINYDDIKDKITNNNCYNFNNRLLSYKVFKEDNILDQLTLLNKEYVVLCQFWSLYKFKNIIDNTIPNYILPSNNIMEKYMEIKNTIIGDQPYNFIHYRYEIDFTNHFRVNITSLETLIDNIKFKNNNLKIFIATSNINKILNCSKYSNIIYKNDKMLVDLNFEERAFIDYMFGLNSVECYGHSKSSFSIMINDLKQTKNYYA